MIRVSVLLFFKLSVYNVGYKHKQPVIIIIGDLLLRALVLSLKPWLYFIHKYEVDIHGPVFFPDSRL